MNSSITVYQLPYTLRNEKGEKRLPTFREVLAEYIKSINFIRDPRQTLCALFECYHICTFLLLIVYLVKYATIWNFLCFIVMVCVLANLINTVWYHRYCSHQAFTFSHPIVAKVCLWTNPIGFREEIYALLHRLHHNISDQDEDPYGPHLGPWGSYVGSGQTGIHLNISREDYERLKWRLRHTGLVFGSFESFQKWRCMESVPHYLARWLFANVFWAGIIYALGGVPFVMSWYASIFFFTFLMRGFNYHGHGREDHPGHVKGWDLDTTTLALNQRFYGYIASEWHNNHHAFRASANNKFLSGQIDLSFRFIQLLHVLGIVADYNDHKEQFLERYAEEIVATRNK